MYFLGYDLGSSSVKVALLHGSENRAIKVLSYPEQEMGMISLQTDWAEQEPELWWSHICTATKRILAETGVDASSIKGIGIAYQMHGLVVVDEQQEALRPAIIWCDGRAIPHGEKAFQEIGPERCLAHLLNSPGNFTAAKLKWVKENEPALYQRIHKAMLPGDFIAMKMTGRITTTITGLSEGTFWDFKENQIGHLLLDNLGIDPALIPDIQDAFSDQGHLTEGAAEQLGLVAGIPIGYRGGDQPNNAMSLGALKAGEIAATGGTSGVVYGVSSKPVYDPRSRVNSFAHVNHTVENPSIGVLLCINGAGIQHRWLNQQVAQQGIGYGEMETMAATVPIGSDGLMMHPFGNGPERMLENKSLSASISKLQFNRHTQAHLFRAGLEGIAFAFVYGIEILQELGVAVQKIRVGNDNLFQSRIFSDTIATLIGGQIEIVATTGAIGAARGAAYTVGQFASLADAMAGEQIIDTITAGERAAYQPAYDRWKAALLEELKA